MMRTTKIKRGWGGRREGAGRPNLSQNLNHSKRVRVNARTPLLVTHEINEGFPSLRRAEFLHQFHIAAQRARTFGFHIVHFLLRKDALLMIIESKDNQALSLGMRSLTGSLAKTLNADSGGGKVFRDRYRLEVLSEPAKMRAALEQVLLAGSKTGRVDRYSSGIYFHQWPKLLGRRTKSVDEDVDLKSLAAAGLALPKSKLAREGWVGAKSNLS